MSDILAAFAAEQEAEEQRERRLRAALAAADDGEEQGEEQGDHGRAAAAAAAATAARPSSAAATGRHSHRRPPSAAAAHRPAANDAATSSAAAIATAAAAPGGPNHPSVDAAELAANFDSDFELRPLLWTQLCAGCPAPEHGELRRALGAAAVDANEALQVEVQTLLSIVGAAQLRSARAKAKQQAQSAAAAASSTSATRSAFSRAALPDSATRQFLAQEVQTLLASLRAQALRSGILQADEEETFGASRPGSSSSSSAGAAVGLAKILPRPETARQKRVLDEAVQALALAQQQGRRDVHSAGGHTHRPSFDAADLASSAPSSRPISGGGGGMVTARPSTARQRSLSSLSNASGDSPRPSSASLSAAASSLSASLQSSDARPDSARAALVRSLRQALQEEHAALLQDVEYLQACLDIEVDSAIAAEVEAKKKCAAFADAAGPAAAASAAVSDEPASVAELRALNEQLKAALVAEEVRSHTLAIMGTVPGAGVGSGLGSGSGPGTSGAAGQPLSARGNMVMGPALALPAQLQQLQLQSPIGAGGPGSFAASFAKSPGPLKAVRVPSASRARPALAASPLAGPHQPAVPTELRSPAATAAAASQSFAARLNEAHTGADSAAAPAPASAAASSGPPSASVATDLQQLFDLNADLFSVGPAVPAAAPTPAPAPQQRPPIPALALGRLHAASASSVVVDHFPPAPAAASSPSSSPDNSGREGSAVAPVTPLRRATNGPGRASVDAPPLASPAAIPAASPTGRSRLPGESPASARAGSKVRSRIQAAQNFQSNVSETS